MKKVFRLHRARREEGMALLFALGFLALMLILGMGFVTTSLLSQKIAANNSSRAQARMFARSAAARAMLNIMLYTDQAISTESDKIGDDQSLISTGSDKVGDLDLLCSYDEVDYKAGSAQAQNGSLDDQLKKTDATGTEIPLPDDNEENLKLNYIIRTRNSDNNNGNSINKEKKYDSKDSRAKWMFFYDAPAGETGRRIIGRAAYQVLPRKASGRLSLYGVTGGSVQDNDCGVYPHNWKGSSLTNYRWGRDIAELDLGATKTLPGWYSQTLSSIPDAYDKLYTSHSSFFPTGDQQDATNMKKRWLEYWFAEGKNPILKDAFPVPDPSDNNKKVYCHRFNISYYYYPPADIGDTSKDNWYDRFKKREGGNTGWGSVTDALKNSSDAVNMLTEKAMPYMENHTDDYGVDPSGLPFLRRIGNEGWSFKDASDTDEQAREKLRRQIAANFNDYCDSDSIPTSDKAADTWSVDDSGTFPNYTGNERTLYINEVALKLADFTAKFSANGENLGYPFSGTKTNHSNVTISKITPTLLAELVSMYDPEYGSEDTADAAAKAANALLKPANYEFHTALQKLSFTLKLRVEFRVRYQFKKRKNGVWDTAWQPALSGKSMESGEPVVEFADGAVVKVDYPQDTTVSITNFEDTAANKGYSFGSVALDDISGTNITQPDSGIFANAIKKALQDKEKNALKKRYGLGDSDDVDFRITEITVSSIRCKFDTDASIKFAPFLLKVKSGAANVPTEVKGVDFVRMDRAGEMTIIAPTDSHEAVIPKNGTTDGEYDLNLAFYVAGFEVRDPRQNLNPNFSDPEKSDWNLQPRIVPAIADANDKELEAPSMMLPDVLPEKTVSTVNGNKVIYKYDMNGGKKNREVSPKEPKYFKKQDDGTYQATAIAASDVDKETAEDPAWLGDGHGQHVSTAYIRNAPMVSPWEIGLIHRGREWQTLNLKRAGGFGTEADAKIGLADIQNNYGWDGEGTEYKNGDGAILEFVKTGIACRCMGKIPLTLLRKKVIDKSANDSDWNGIDAAYNKDIIRMLFKGIRKNQTMKQFYEEAKFYDINKNETPQAQGGTEITANDNVVDGFVDAVDSLYGTDGKDFQLRSQFLNTDYGDDNSAYTFGLAGTDNDAQREEVIGKTINLLTVNEVTPPNIIKVFVVAQTINDVGGIENDVSITKGGSTQGCQIGRFDFARIDSNWENNIYFDEITGEVKALVTIERIPQTNDQGARNDNFGRMVITGIEFID